MKPNTVRLNHTYWTILAYQHGGTTASDSIMILPVTVLYIEQKEHSKPDVPRVCVCTTIDSYGGLPETLEPRKIEEARLYQSFDEAWNRLENTFKQAIADTSKWREAMRAAKQDINEPVSCHQITLNTYIK